MRVNALEQNKTTKWEASCVYHVPKNNSTESKPAGLGWECCGLASPTELNWNALFVFQQACKGWQRSGQLFKPCWTAFRVQFLYLVRGPVEKLRVKQVVFEQCVEWVYSAWKNMCCLRKMCPCALFWSKGLLCNRNVSNSLGNHFMLVTLHRLV